MVELEENHSEEAVTDKINNLIWDENQADVVADFLKGNTLPPEDKDSHLWNKLNISTDLETSETPMFISTISPLFESVDNPSSPDDEDNDETNVTGGSENISDKEEYTFSVKESARVLTKLTIDSLRRHGIWDNSEFRRAKEYAGTRSAGKKTYAQSALTGEEIDEKGYLDYQSGGPGIVEAIYPPRFGETKNTSGNRIRKSLGHEIQHVLRSLVNKNIWRGYEKQAAEYGLRVAESADKRNFIGGFYVASNMQGSEAVGELLSRSIEFKLENGRDATIQDMIPLMEERISKSVSKTKKSLKEGKSVSIRYLPAKFALLSHLKDLSVRGCADLKTTDLVALGTLGYISFEKAPELIRLGVIDQNKFQRNKEVVNEVYNWLTSDTEK